MSRIYSLLFIGLCCMMTFDVAEAKNITCRPSRDTCYFKGDKFEHPNSKCHVCECCEDGVWTCVLKTCEKPKCGILKQTNFTEDKCCKKCCDECLEEQKNCPTLTCKVQAYKRDACCPSCGCNYNNFTVPVGKFGHSCDNCECFENGTAVCKRPECPAERLQCVNPTYESASNCTWICPTGRLTCRRGPYLIPAGKVVRIKDKICACHPVHYYPRAFCANRQDKFGKRFSDLWYGKCLEKYKGNEIQNNAEMMMHPLI